MDLSIEALYMIFSTESIVDTRPSFFSVGMERCDFVFQGINQLLGLNACNGVIIKIGHDGVSISGLDLNIVHRSEII